MGLKYNANSILLDNTKVYGQAKGSGGRFFLGLGQSFIKFDKNYQKVVMRSNDPEATRSGITARTKDGLSINLGVAFQYTYKHTAAALYQLYTKYEGGHAEYYERFARSKIRDTASLYNANQYFTDRLAIMNHMKADLTARFTTEEIDLQGFQLLNIDIPKTLADAIEATAIANEGIGKATYAQAALRVSSQTDVLKTVEANKVLLLNSEASALGVNITANAAAVRTRVLNDALKTSYASYKAALNMSNPEFLKSIWINTVGSPAAKATLNVPVPTSVKLL